MFKYIYLAILLTANAIGADQYTIQEQLALIRQEYTQEINSLKQQIATQAKQIESLQDLGVQHRINSPTYTKFIPADIILASSLILATAASYQTYISTGSIFQTFYAFCSNVYVFYVCLKFIRDTASVTASSPLANHLKTKLKD